MSTYTPKTITSGNELMLFVKDASSNYVSIAHATSHTLSISGTTSSVQSKDTGLYSNNSVNAIEWSISSSNLMTDDFNGLFDKFVGRTTLEVVLGEKSQNNDSSTVADGDYEYWTLDTSTSYLSGKAVITSLNVNANAGEDSTYDVELTGTGKLTRVTA